MALWLLLASRSEPVGTVEATGKLKALAAFQRAGGGTVHHSGSFTPSLHAGGRVITAHRARRVDGEVMLAE